MSRLTKLAAGICGLGVVALLSAPLMAQDPGAGGGRGARDAPARPDADGDGRSAAARPRPHRCAARAGARHHDGAPGRLQGHRRSAEDRARGAAPGGDARAGRRERDPRQGVGSIGGGSRLRDSPRAYPRAGLRGARRRSSRPRPRRSAPSVRSAARSARSGSSSGGRTDCRSSDGLSATCRLGLPAEPSAKVLSPGAAAGCRCARQSHPRLETYIMKRRAWIVALSVAALAGAARCTTGSTRARSGPNVMTGVVTRGAVVETVQATGTLQPVDTVEVGSQVTGSVQDAGRGLQQPRDGWPGAGHAGPGVAAGAGRSGLGHGGAAGGGGQPRQGHAGRRRDQAAASRGAEPRSAHR